MSWRWLFFCIGAIAISGLALADRSPVTVVGGLRATPGPTGSTGATGTAGTTGATGQAGPTCVLDGGIDALSIVFPIPLVCGGSGPSITGDGTGNILMDDDGLGGSFIVLDKDAGVGTELGTAAMDGPNVKIHGLAVSDGFVTCGGVAAGYKDIDAGLISGWLISICPVDGGQGVFQIANAATDLDLLTYQTFPGSGTPDQFSVTAQYTAEAYNWIGTETGMNNAIAGQLEGLLSAVPPSPGLSACVQLAHSLQAGANTFNLNGTGPEPIVQTTNPANNIAVGYVPGGIWCGLFDGSGWETTTEDGSGLSPDGGAPGYLAEFAPGGGLQDSPVFDNGGLLGLGTNVSSASLEIDTDAGITALSTTSNTTAWTIQGQNTGTGGVGVKGIAQGLTGTGTSGVDATPDGGIGIEAFSVNGTSLQIEFGGTDPQSPVFWAEESAATITKTPIVGNCYHDNTSHLINCWNGSAWIAGVQGATGSTGAVGATGVTGAVGKSDVSGPGNCVLTAGITPSCTFSLSTLCNEVWSTSSTGNMATTIGPTGTITISSGTVTVTSSLTLGSNVTVYGFCFPGF